MRVRMLPIGHVAPLAIERPEKGGGTVWETVHHIPPHSSPTDWDVLHAPPQNTSHPNMHVGRGNRAF